MERIRTSLKRGSHEQFYFQLENLRRAPQDCHDYFILLCFQQEKLNAADYSLLNMIPLPVGDADEYSLDDVKAMTNNFSDKYLIKDTIHGRLFKGFIRDHEVTIKTWDFFYPRQKCYEDHPSRFSNELEILTVKRPLSKSMKIQGFSYKNVITVVSHGKQAKILSQEKPHPTLMKIRGFCFQNILAVVYDERQTRFLSQEIFYAKNFGWNDRVKVATQLASLFTWLHGKRISFGFVKASTIMIDKDFNVKVFDFGFLANEDSRNRAHYRLCIDAPEVPCGSWTLKSDVFTFGLLLVDLFANKRNRCRRDDWVARGFQDKEFQGDYGWIVDKSLLQVDDDRANRIAELVATCLDMNADARPDMKDVFVHLSSLGEQN